MKYDREIMKKLLSGEKVVCEKCGKGSIVPAGPVEPMRVQVDFVCDSCGEKYRMVPPISAGPRPVN